MPIDQLSHIFVTSGDHHVEALLAGLARQSANNIIGLHAYSTDKRQSHGFDNFVDGLDLLAQLIGHWWPIGFIKGINIVPKSLSLGVKHHGHRAVRIVFLQPPEHVDNALYRPGSLALGVVEWWQCVKGAVNIGGAIYQYYRGYI